MQRQVWKKDAEKNRRAHLRVTLSLGFLMCFEAVMSRVSVSVNPVDVLPCCSSRDCKVKAFTFTPKIIHILRGYLKDRTDEKPVQKASAQGPGEHRVLYCSSWSPESFSGPGNSCKMQERWASTLQRPSSPLPRPLSRVTQL